MNYVNKPMVVPPKKPSISIHPDDKALGFIRKGGKLKAIETRNEKTLEGCFLVYEHRDDLTFIKEEFKFHQDRLRKLEADYKAAVKQETKDFFRVLEASSAYRPHRVKLVWEA
jgi:hypothetical protein